MIFGESRIVIDNTWGIPYCHLRVDEQPPVGMRAFAYQWKQSVHPEGARDSTSIVACLTHKDFERLLDKWNGFSPPKPGDDWEFYPIAMLYGQDHVLQPRTVQ